MDKRLLRRFGTTVDMIILGVVLFLSGTGLCMFGAWLASDGRDLFNRSDMGKIWPVDLGAYIFVPGITLMLIGLSLLIIYT